jgi:hypothetical protein
MARRGRFKLPWRLPDGVANERILTKHTRKSQKQKKTQAEKSSHTMRVANADSDWDIHCVYLPRDPATAWCGVGERHNFEKQVYGPRRTGAPADEPDVELGFHDALRVARLVAKGDQMTLGILLSRPVYAIAEENVASMASREADGVVEEKLRVDGVKSGRGRGERHREDLRVDGVEVDV